jgi:hypothetical protein
VRGTFVAGKLQTTTPRSAEYDVCIHCIGEDTHLGIIAIARLDGTPLGGDEATDYLLTDQQGNIYKWRWTGDFAGTFYLGEVVG